MSTRARWIVVVNPAAGRGRSRRYLAALQPELRAAGIDYELVASGGPGDGVRIVRQAAGAGFRRFVALGGDGTAHEVANGILRHEPSRWPEFTMALAPVGTGNDWARWLRLPHRPRDVAGLLAAGSIRTLDAGLARFDHAAAERPADSARADPPGVDRYFVNIAGVGFDAHVVRLLGDGRGGLASYLRGLLRGLRSFESPTLDIVAEGHTSTCRLLLGLACVGRYFGGGMNVNPSARGDTGLLRCVLVQAMSAARVLLELRRVFDGTIESSRYVRTLDASTIDIEPHAASVQAGVQADGEWIGHAPVRFAAVPRALRVAVAPARSPGSVP